MLTILTEEPNIIDDAKITLQVKSRIAMEKGIPLDAINLKTSSGVVFLTGILNSQEQASAIVKIAASIPEVKDVNTSDLEIRENNQPLVDIYITAKVKGVFLREKLFGDKEVSAMSVSVETKDGIVYLSGAVDKKELEENAINLARQIKGVREVISSIKFK